MTSPTLRALGQVIIVYFAISGSAVTAQDLQPGRATFAEMIAFARLASLPCKRLAPDVEGFHALVLQRLIKPPLAQEEIAAKEKDVKRLRERLGMVQALCRRNGTSPYSRSGSTKAELAAYPRDHFWRSTIAPRPSSPTMWNEFLPISMPIMAIALCAVAAMDRAASGARQSSGPGRHHMILIALFVYCNGAAQCGRWQRVLGKVFVREGAK
jgi:hypothetical protein